MTWIVFLGGFSLKTSEMSSVSSSSSFDGTSASEIFLRSLLGATGMETFQRVSWSASTSLKSLDFFSLMRSLRRATVLVGSMSISKEVLSPSTRQNRVRRLSAIVLRSIKGKERWEKESGTVKRVKDV